MRFEQVFDEVKERLAKEIPAFVAYHNAEHSLYVLQKCIYLSEKEGMDKAQLELLKTGAIMHDTGFIFDSNTFGHEERSCEYADTVLPKYGFEDSEIEVVKGLIMATKLPQSPKNKLEQILCDADLYYLGTENYFNNSDKLVSELRDGGQELNEKRWLEVQIEFLNNHSFFTKTAKHELETKKKENLTKVEDRMKSISKQSETSKIQAYAQEYLMIAFGVLIAAVALKGFLVPNHFFDGGVTGLSLLIHELYHVNLALVIVLMNIPLIIIGYFTVGKAFTIKTFVAVVLLGVVLQTLPVFDLTHDKLLISIFGGVFLGL